jgi:5-methylcytosine-specific restriction enzyme A
MIAKHVKDIVQGKASVGVKRSSRWSQVRKDHLREHSECAVCGGTKKLEVHHIKPFCDFPELELDPNNLITLCESKSKGIMCHMTVGHLGNYKTINPMVSADSEYLQKMFERCNKNK